MLVLVVDQSALPSSSLSSEKYVLYSMEGRKVQELPHRPYDPFGGNVTSS